MATVLREYAAEPRLDLARVLKMVLVHDLVEIDAGDTYCYDAQALKDQSQRERQAADRVFGLLPPDQARELKGLWEEFEAAETAEAQFAATLDRLQPLLHNVQTGGGSWQQHGVRKAQVLARNLGGRQGSPDLWSYANELIEQAVRDGVLAE
jgi:putative hydrolase of HD superfamily